MAIAFTPGKIWLDNTNTHINAHGGGVLYHQGVYYWFGEHKIEGEAGNRAHVGVHCYSSHDLYNWKDEGIALAVSSDPTSEIIKGCTLERPKVLYCAATGKFVMWFHLELKDHGYSAARAGVAVADSPAGPYTFVRSFRPNAGHWPKNAPAELRRELSADEVAAIDAMKLRSGPAGVPHPANGLFQRDFATGQMSRDMTLFLDDDGSAYHIHAAENNGTLHISKLAPDFLSSSGEYVRIFQARFHEGPAIFKRRGTYYLLSSDCTGWDPNPARSASAPSIWGPWTELGNPCRGTDAQIANTFESQSTFVLPVAGKPGAFIFLADRWCPKNAIDGRYVWLPLEWESDKPVLRWHDQWDLSFFGR